MKTLKTFFLLLAMVVTNSSYAQTKEETIEWLNTNGRDFLKMSFVSNETKFEMRGELLEVKSDTLIFVHGFHSLCNNCHFSYKTTKVPLNSIMYQDINSIPIKMSDFSTHNFPVGTSYFNVKTNGFFDRFENEKGEKQKWYFYEESPLEIPFDKANEENAKRTLKARMHLAKLSGAKENKQTF